MEKQKALNALSALAQETRIDVYRLLVKAGPEGMAAGAIAEKLGVMPNTLSSHLGILANAGLVKAERAGRVIRYAAELDAMQGLLAYLMRDCCGGNPQVCGPLAGLIEETC
ncbi:DNA-binding transcriptional ArsR family regulator [Rhodobium orientis]|uniref:Transcriptional regulator n=1 Tax=Rhodobium orientis TaxID=34017 RepID=A0A327JE69_9HYPH|nr:winged helix-turn-helix domain-containing protein [Rhodobium orientis]MBB4305491.1 DNA-binding transcriptional ArsR family regulator [Rhodobium orientis]MBK5949869.1 transcriptional regulator [Rhodobium orientis]RAI24130.1 transcriptional regulator [Rhodobium orientis]